MKNINEVSPPGFEATVKAMKKHKELSKGKTKDGKEKNIYALAWHMHNKGDKSHYKLDKKGNPVKKKTFKEWLEEKSQ